MKRFQNWIKYVNNDDIREEIISIKRKYYYDKFIVLDNVIGINGDVDTLKIIKALNMIKVV